MLKLLLNIDLYNGCYVYLEDNMKYEVTIIKIIDED